MEAYRIRAAGNPVSGGQPHLIVNAGFKVQVAARSLSELRV